jgi:hypothetical protein
LRDEWSEPDESFYGFQLAGGFDQDRDAAATFRSFER